MMTKRLWITGMAFGFAVALMGLAQFAVAGPGPGETRIQISLAGSTNFPKGGGRAEFRSRPGRNRLTIDVQNVPELNGSTVQFFQDSSLLGSKTVTLGAAQLEVNTGLTSVSGVTVSVKKTDGTLVASGTF